MSRLVYPNGPRQLVDDFLGAVFGFESLARLEVERDDFVTSKHLAANGSDFADPKEILDGDVVFFLRFLLTAGASALLFLVLLFLAFNYLFDYLLHALVFLFALGS